MRYTIKSARHSQLATFPTKIVLVDYTIIGTSEQIRRHQVLNEVEKSIEQTGYHGPPIAVYGFGTDELFHRVSDGDILDELVPGDIGVADGHHRLEAITRLGQRRRLKRNLVPVQLIPAHDRSFVRLVTLHDDETPLSLAELEAPFKQPQQFIPPQSTTHFQIKLGNGEWTRIFNALPELVIAKDELVLPLTPKFQAR